ncbi:uncharacterized protein LOC126678148 [Mercurialis annua]|uniref:uncharacterized protein LOC126678148 n=1 Tax=Mercurialis annua TaxID=3986 RepID=UPI0024AF8883|nr:uncharacterized protein LOC126678148 [Mercurialis annua]
MNQLLSKPIRTADQVIRSAYAATSYKHECCKIMFKTRKLTAMFQKMLIMTLADPKFYDRPIYRVIESTHEILEDTLSLVLRCSAKGLKKYLYDLSILPATDFGKSLIQLEKSIRDVHWLLEVCFSSNHGIGKCTYWPPFANNETYRYFVWKQIAILYTGPLDDKSDAAAVLLSIARDSDYCWKLIIEEGGVEPLLKLLKEGEMKCLESAAKAIGYLGRDPESVEYLIRIGVCNVFAVILKEGPMKVQSAVAWAVSQLVANYPKCQDKFFEHNIVGSLIKHLSFEIVQERIQNEFVVNKATSVLAIVMARNRLNASKAMEELEDNQPRNVTLSPVDTETKNCMKAMAAKALCVLVRGNIKICRHITESRALACFVFLLDKGAKDVPYFSAMALMEITALAEQDSDLRRSTFRSSSPARKIVVDQLVRTIEAGEDSVISILCIKAIGNLAWTFRVGETRIIALLVRLLDKSVSVISREAAVALSKFSCTENYLHLDHSKAIIEAGGAEILVRLVNRGERVVQSQALLLLCYIALHVPTSEKLARTKVSSVLEWASTQSLVIQDQTFDSLLPKAKSMVLKTVIPLYSAR